MAYQTTVPQQPTLGTPGTLADTTWPHDAVTVFAEVDSAAGAPLEDSALGILPGQLVLVGSVYEQARLPHALAADADAIIATGASSTSAQDLVATDFDGVVGATRWPVPTLVDLVLSASADWLATNATITGIDSNGALTSETLAIPAGGNATVSTTNRYVQITRLQIPIQGGATGTFTLGVQGPAGAALTKAVIHGVASNDQYREGSADFNGISSGANGTPYVDTEDLAAYRFSRLWVRTENVVLEGAPAFARVVNSAAAGSPSNIGQFRSDADGGNALIVPGARYRRVDGTIAEIEVNFRD